MKSSYQELVERGKRWLTGRLVVAEKDTLAWHGANLSRSLWIT